MVDLPTEYMVFLTHPGAFPDVMGWRSQIAPEIEVARGGT